MKYRGTSAVTRPSAYSHSALPAVRANDLPAPPRPLGVRGRVARRSRRPGLACPPHSEPHRPNGPTWAPQPRLARGLPGAPPRRSGKQISVSFRWWSAQRAGGRRRRKRGWDELPRLRGPRVGAAWPIAGRGGVGESLGESLGASPCYSGKTARGRGGAARRRGVRSQGAATTRGNRAICTCCGR